jgi:hypothetical protein
MSDTFDRLCALKARPRPEEPARGTIVVEGVDPFRSFNQHSCLIGIDGQRVATLDIFRTAASFEVLAGDHQMTVRLGPDFSKPLSIRVEAGQRLEMVCGKKKEWMQFERRVVQRITLISLVGYGLMALGWLTYPLLRGIVVETVYRLDLQGGAAALGHKLGLTRPTTAVIVFLGSYIPLFVAFCVRIRNDSKRLRLEIGPRCFLGFKTSSSP